MAGHHPGDGLRRRRDYAHGAAGCGRVIRAVETDRECEKIGPVHIAVPVQVGICVGAIWRGRLA